MHIYKFGGTSQGSSQALEASLGVVRRDDKRKAIIVSAPSGVTDLLWMGTEEALRSKEVPKRTIDMIANRFEEVYSNVANTSTIINQHIDILANRFSQVNNLKKEREARFIANIVSFGEELESQLYTLLLNQNNIPSRRLPENLVILEGDYLNGTYNRISDKKIKDDFEKDNLTIVVPGYYGHNLQGERVVFGRGGSDFTQTLVARAVQASACYNCTDVNGVMPINPKILPEELRKSIKTIRQLSYEQAQELSRQGAKILHPRCITPLREAGIDLYVINTFNPEGEYTHISNQVSEESTIIAVTGKDDSYMTIKLHAGDMEGQKGYFLAFANSLKEIDIDTVTTSSVEIKASFTKNGADLETIKKELEKYGEVDIHNGSSLIAIVGNNIGKASNLGRVFTTIYNANIPIGQISKSNEESLWLSIPSKHYQQAQVAIYSELLR